MKRLGLLAALLSLFSIGFAAPVAAAEVEARIVQFAPGFRQNLVDITSVTYDPDTHIARIYFTTHCFVQSFSPDPETPPTVGQSSVATIDWEATQRATTVAGALGDGTIIDLDPDWRLCDRDFIAVIPDLEPGSAKLSLSVMQIAFNIITTTATFRVILPAR